MSPEANRKRCAIYTRKSIRIGLEQEFNSLQGQRAICSAYITSQRHKGWLELAKSYDDGGYSGASLSRPALQDLLGDIEHGFIDVVVIYKLDRMTRTLLDFVRLIDFFERHDVVFVSITQNFDTADAMGRLILNVLLTFAQFEREMCADRIRDKVRMTRQAGRWSGGQPPLGYDLYRHKLYINPEEANLVRTIFERYLILENKYRVFKELKETGARTKKWRTKAGITKGGRPVDLSCVDYVLRNPVYVGDVRHNDERYLGIHAPIIDRAQFDKVQKILAAQARSKQARNKRHYLTDLLFDSFGRPMSAHTTPKSKRSRHYISRQSAWGARRNLKRMSSPADQIEELVVASLQEFLGNRERVRAMLLKLACRGRQLDELGRKGEVASERLGKVPLDQLRLILRSLIERIELSLDRVKIVMRCTEVERFLRWDGVGLFRAQKSDWRRTGTELLDLPVGAARYNRLLSMPVAPRPEPRSGRHPNHSLLRAIREARQCQALMDAERDKTLEELAAEMNFRPHYFARILRLNYLAPDIVTSIIDGTSPPGLTRSALIKAHLPTDWSLQRRLLGFAPRPELEGGE